MFLAVMAVQWYEQVRRERYSFIIFLSFTIKVHQKFVVRIVPSGLNQTLFRNWTCYFFPKILVFFKISRTSICFHTKQWMHAFRSVIMHIKIKCAALKFILFVRFMRMEVVLSKIIQTYSIYKLVLNNGTTASQHLDVLNHECISHVTNHYFSFFICCPYLSSRYMSS